MKWKKGQKKQVNIFQNIFVDSEGSQKVEHFSTVEKRQYPNDRLLVQNLHTTCWQTSENTRKKRKVVTTGLRSKTESVAWVSRSRERSSLNLEGQWESCGYFYLRILKFWWCHQWHVNRILSCVSFILCHDSSTHGASAHEYTCVTLLSNLKFKLLNKRHTD